MIVILLFQNFKSLKINQANELKEIFCIRCVIYNEIGDIVF